MALCHENVVVSKVILQKSEKNKSTKYVQKWPKMRKKWSKNRQKKHAKPKKIHSSKKYAQMVFPVFYICVRDVSDVSDVSDISDVCDVSSSVQGGSR